MYARTFTTVVARASIDRWIKPGRIGGEAWDTGRGWQREAVVVRGTADEPTGMWLSARRSGGEGRAVRMHAPVRVGASCQAEATGRGWVGGGAVQWSAGRGARARGEAEG